MPDVCPDCTANGLLCAVHLRPSDPRPLTAEEDGLNAKHQPITYDDDIVPGREWCRECGQLWPCATTRLLATITVERAEKERIYAEYQRIVALENETAAERDAVRAHLVASLTDEDEIAHGEAVSMDFSGEMFGLGICAYCDKPWPCPTQSAIDRALAALR